MEKKKKYKKTSLTLRLAKILLTCIVCAVLIFAIVARIIHVYKNHL